MNWAILLGSPDISGGTYVIFEHAIRAKRRGHEVTIITEEPVQSSRLDWHPEARELTWKTFDEVADVTFDLAFATWWRTVYELHRVTASQYAYFVQSIEAWFYPPEERPLRQLADATYMIGLPIITEAKWIQQHLQKTSQTDAYLVRNGIRKDIYTLEGDAHDPRQDGKLRVLVEGPLGVPFKNVERTIELCRKSQADEVWLLTSSPIDSHPNVDRVFSRIPIFETPRVYRSCDVIVKLSYVEGMFGPPLEMFHCGGTAITYDVTGHDEYIRNGENAFVAPRDDEAQVVAYLNRLKQEPEELRRLKAEARATALAWPDWETTAQSFIAAAEQICQQGTLSQALLHARSRFFFDSYAIAQDYKNAVQTPGIKASLQHLKRAVKTRLKRTLTPT